MLQKDLTMLILSIPCSDATKGPHNANFSTNGKLVHFIALLGLFNCRLYPWPTAQMQVRRWDGISITGRFLSQGMPLNISYHFEHNLALQNDFKEKIQLLRNLAYAVTNNWINKKEFVVFIFIYEFLLVAPCCAEVFSTLIRRRSQLTQLMDLVILSAI